jgi:hypothetical protein
MIVFSSSSSTPASTAFATTAINEDPPLLQQIIDRYRRYRGIPAVVSDPVEEFENRFQIENCRVDGQCWYHALAIILEEDDDPQRFRKAIANIVEVDRRRYEPHTDEENVNGIRSGEWAYGRPVIIYDSTTQ